MRISLWFYEDIVWFSHCVRHFMSLRVYYIYGQGNTFIQPTSVLGPLHSEMQLGEHKHLCLATALHNLIAHNALPLVY